MRTSRSVDDLIARAGVLRFVTVCLLLVVFTGAATADQPSRIKWITSRIQGTPDPPLPYTIEPVFTDVTLNSPTEMIRVPGTDRWIVTEVGGKIVSFSKGADRDYQLALDIREATPRSGQLYGITFHRDYPEQPWCYIAYTAQPNSMTGTRLSRFRVTDTSVPKIDRNSETVFASWNSEGHSGGSLHFGRDGYLYVSVGDGQNPNPPDKLDTGQDLSDLEASILRIDVDHPSPGLPYRIPDDNPFVGQDGIRPEIWAYGFRNPWKMAFDPKSNTLWTGDVGWEMMEMVYRIDRGANYGWSVMEGSQVVKKDGARTSTPITPPIVEHTHLEARSITGGYFWYGDRLPELSGTYLYGDWMTGKIWGLRHDGQQLTWQQELADTTLRVICFALDDDGEVLVVGYDGTIHRLVPNPQPASTAEFPRRLSETGLFASTAEQIPAAGVIPYEINAHHWADGTESQQWIALSGDSQLTMYANSDWKTGQVKDHFEFPHDAVLAKTISYRDAESDGVANRRLETQVLHRHGDDWNAYNYVWNDEQTDAILQDNVGSDREIKIVDTEQDQGFRTQVWHHASRDECSLCHIWSAGTVHGFKLNQINRVDADGKRNQLERLENTGIFAVPVRRVDPIASPYDPQASLAARARSYLHMNCAHCHRRGGGGTAAFELVGNLPLEKLDLVDARPTQGDFGITNPKVVASGDPYRSVLMYRMIKSGRGRMPQFGPTLIDQRGVRLIHDWIASMKSWRIENGALDFLSSQSSPLSAEAVDGINAMLGSTDDALALSLACGDPSVSHPLRLAVADVASQHSNGVIRDLFERFLPPERRAKRLGTAIDADALLAMKGDVEKGRDLYFQSQDVTCQRCHKIGEQGTAVGPDLSSIGLQRTPTEILDSILRPSAKIDPKYQSQVVVTIDGRAVSGLVTHRDYESVTIVEATGKPMTIASDDIETIRAMPKSVMPDLQLAEFTAQQAADLLAFLSAQRAPLPETAE